MLIRKAEVHGHGIADVRLAGQRIAAVGTLAALPGEAVLEAQGGMLLPGLHDHHIHLAGLAARRSSVACGPPDVTDRNALALRLAVPGTGWIRGILYHESVMGLPDARELDALVAERPLRIQHRSGRMWLLNSRALDELLAAAEPPPGLEREAGRFTGRLFDEDAWLRRALGSTPPDFADVSGELARLGVIGITDMTPQNDPAMAANFADQRRSGALRQRCVLAGTLALADAPPHGWERGSFKLHLHEAALPDFDETASRIATTHAQGRCAAIHCVSEVELVFALAVLEQAGTAPGDRIEHASVVPEELIARIAAMDLAVCVQPHFVAERGDRYLRDVEQRDRAGLYRLASLANAGIALAGGSDAPFAGADPWAAMRAAISRRTDAGAIIGEAEALSPEAALALYLADPSNLRRQRRIAPGEPADLCLMNQPWREVRTRLDAADVRAVFASGRRIDDSVDQSPG